MQKWIFLAVVLNLLKLGLFESTISDSKESGQNYAYVTVLSSDDFILAAKVVSFQLRTFNKEIPFIIYCTEDVSNRTMADLEEFGAITRRILKFDSPFSVEFPGKKFQYTKTRLWCHTEFSRIVYIDLDTIMLADTSEMFHCGEFCASVRHSDKFNAGIFVLKPDRQVCEDMFNASARLKSYDGGDQGFFNTYFSDLKFALMFNPENLSSTVGSDGLPKQRTLRLSAVYNYDVGMYYLSGRMLLQPKIIHYTLGPVKPWIWWTYPIFDLNWQWLDVRARMETEFGSQDNLVLSIIKQIGLLTLLSAVYFVTKKRNNTTTDENAVVCGYERSLTGIVMLIFALGIAFVLTDEQMWPTHAWIIFTINMAMVLVFCLKIYSNQRLKIDLPLSMALNAAVALIGSIVLFWNILYCIQKPGKRYVAGVFFIITTVLGVNEVIKLVLFSQQCRLRYIPLRKQ